MVVLCSSANMTTESSIAKTEANIQHTLQLGTSTRIQIQVGAQSHQGLRCCNVQLLIDTSYRTSKGTSTSELEPQQKQMNACTSFLRIQQQI